VRENPRPVSAGRVAQSNAHPYPYAGGRLHPAWGRGVFQHKSSRSFARGNLRSERFGATSSVWARWSSRELFKLGQGLAVGV